MGMRHIREDVMGVADLGGMDRSSRDILFHKAGVASVVYFKRSLAQTFVRAFPSLKGIESHIVKKPKPDRGT